ncbi:MAG: DUF2510 domain-containing protein [Actinomycetota bacterium]
MTTPGWYRDPTGAGDGRYWDGQRWTDSVTRGGYTVTSAVDPARAEIPPPPGSELVAEPRPQAAAGQHVTVSAGGTGGSRSPLAAILGAVAVVVAIIAIVIALSNSSDSDDDETPDTTEAPVTTVAPDPEPEPEPEG